MFTVSNIAGALLLLFFAFLLYEMAHDKGYTKGYNDGFDKGTRVKRG